MPSLARTLRTSPVVSFRWGRQFTDIPLLYTQDVLTRRSNAVTAPPKTSVQTKASATLARTSSNMSGSSSAAHVKEIDSKSASEAARSRSSACGSADADGPPPGGQHSHTAAMAVCSKPSAAGAGAAPGASAQRILLSAMRQVGGAGKLSGRHLASPLLGSFAERRDAAAQGAPCSFIPARQTLVWLLCTLAVPCLCLAVRRRWLHNGPVSFCMQSMNVPLACACTRMS